MLTGIQAIPSHNVGALASAGGHGAIWKLMLDEGVFDWFRDQGRRATIVRQISNPMAGTDVTLLALGGERSSRETVFHLCFGSALG